MTSTRTKLLLASSLALVAAAGYQVYSLYAQASAPTLAQAPMNIENSVPPAFIMAVDDSNSMTFERIFPGGDGRMRWNSNTDSFFNNDGSFFSIGQACGSVDCYLYLYPHDGYSSSYSPGRAIPPLDVFGFARSHVYNASYFNPAVTYEPWKQSNGDPWPNAVPEATRADPRNPGTYGNSFSRAYNVQYDLTQDRVRTDETFSMLDGMRIPNLAGTDMRYRWNNQWSTQARTINSNTSIAFDYFPATFYLPAAAPAPAGYRTGDAYRPIIDDACGPGCDMRRYQIKAANYTSTANYDTAIQNFANWFQYHRNRLLAMVGAMTHATYEVNDMRVGYFTINNRNNVTMHELPAQRDALYQQMNRLQAGLLALGSGGGTPNRDAVRHLGEQFRRTGNGAPIEYACQANGGMLFTDGFTNSGTGPTNVSNVDGSLGAPFADNFSHTIADIAAQYYLDSGEGGFAPLRSDGPNFSGDNRGQVPVPDQCDEANPDRRLDCQSNLHMNFYGVTLGARGSIYGVNAAATEDPWANPPNWNAGGNPRDSDGAATVDEIWHATINSRGRFINADTPADITNAMREILSAASGGGSTSGAIAVTGSRIGSGSLTVVPYYESKNNGTDWYGKLTAQTVTSDPITGAVSRTDAWEASARMASQPTRSIEFATTSNSVKPTLRAFSAANVSLANLCANGAPMARCTASMIQNDLKVGITEAIAYLRGSRALEGTKLRTRSSILGDIVNSTPVVSVPSDDYGYRTLRGSNGSYDSLGYAEYLETKKASRRPMVYVGANDGMFHAFDGRATGATRGREDYAYIPATALGHMGNLLFPYVPEDDADQVFQHRYFVDGPVVVSDAYFAGGWKTVVVGTSGAGGRSVFALDVTNPDDIDVLWEVNNLITGNNAISRNMGHVLGKPVIVPVDTATGIRWKAIFGNGYNSQNQQAVLFVVDIQNGTVETIVASESGGDVPGYNGLGNLVVVDRYRKQADGTSLQGRDGMADTVYAGDQNGAVWKFDLRNNSVALGGEPLYVARDAAGNRQTITGGLEAASGPGGGVIVYFGTGSFSFTRDTVDNSQQSVYAILDNGDAAVSGRAQLLQQTVGSDDGEFRSTSVNTMSFGKSGWYMDLPAGERFVGYPELESGIIFFPTYSPADRSADSCAIGGTNWLYGLNALNGAAAMSSVKIGSPTGESADAGTGAIGLNTNGSAPVKDVAVLTTPRIGPLEPDATEEDIENATAARCSMVVQVAGAEPLYLLRPCGRQSWRQVR